MRLSDTERKFIKDVVLELDPSVQIYLFGSRACNEKKGGDIDILIISSTIAGKNRRMLKLKLYDALGEQKIDLLITSALSEPFVQIALEDGILL